MKTNRKTAAQAQWCAAWSMLSREWREALMRWAATADADITSAATYEF